ncbi:MAG: hypothetical protein R3F41_04160 [Gammaproteobacteria bacterium]|nr:hypothetical protein [Pseudomonadales bacterium]MCP5345513.1 hypothetical protein [Pseudomonadales bacterium]
MASRPPRLTGIVSCPEGFYPPRGIFSFAFVGRHTDVIMANSFMRPANFIRIALLFMLGLVVVILVLSLQRNASVVPAPALTSSEISRVEQLLVDSAPGDVNSSELRKLSLSNAELDLLLRYAAEMVGPESGIHTRIQLPGEHLIADLSVPVSVAFVPLFLNLSADFSSDNENLQLTSLKLGRLRIPGKLVNSLAEQVEIRYLQRQSGYREFLELLDSVKYIGIESDRLELDFLWEPGLLSQVRTQAQKLLISESDQRRIVSYQRTLSRLIDTIPASSRAISLSTLLVPLFEFARQESLLGSDPVAENRALLLTLAAYVNQEGIEQWLTPELADRLPKPRIIEVRIQRRLDLARHVVSSAAISASAGLGVAQILSSVKENYDARYRTGFSFSDLTANRAGMSLGTLATRSPELALEMQRRMVSVTGDTDYLPLLESNLDGMTEFDFAARYRDEKSSDYQLRLQEIDQLIAGLPLFHGLPIY